MEWNFTFIDVKQPSPGVDEPITAGLFGWHLKWDAVHTDEIEAGAKVRLRQPACQ
jgi:hypothetical protein